MTPVRDIPWVIGEHTKVKHALLRQYVSTWMSILWQQQVSIRKKQFLGYMDGFAGPGLYYADENKSSTVPGSSVLVAQIANDLRRRFTNAILRIDAVDTDQGCVDSLDAELRKINVHRLPWRVSRSTFEDAVDQLLRSVSPGDFPPTFFFIDPFGYSGVTIHTLSRILALERTEIFVTFMIYDVVRFLEAGHAEQALDALFGNTAYKQAATITNPDEKAAALVTLFCDQLRYTAGGRFVLPFRVNTSGKGTRPRYALIHVSNNIKALKEMKNAMAKTTDVPFRFEAVGRIKGQLSLFVPEEKHAIADAILGTIKIKGNVAYDELEDWAYVNTPAVARDLKEALILLEKQGKLTIERIGRQRRTTVTSGARIQSVGK